MRELRVQFASGGRILIGCPNSLEGDYVIPAGTVEISRYAFAACCRITSVFVPDSVTSIGDFAFAECRQLHRIVLPDLCWTAPTAFSPTTVVLRRSQEDARITAIFDAVAAAGIGVVGISPILC